MTAARSVDLEVWNNTSDEFELIGSHLDHGIWSTTPPIRIPALTRSRLQAESSGVFTGTAGWARYEGRHGHNLLIAWSKPYEGDTVCTATPSHTEFSATAHIGPGTNARGSIQISSEPTTRVVDFAVCWFIGPSAGKALALPNWVSMLTHGANWSIPAYWRRQTFGFLEPRFRRYEIIEVDQSTSDALHAPGQRGTAVTRARALATAQYPDITASDNLIAVVQPPGCDAGASGTQLLLDEAPYAYGFFLHEFGHALGFQHTFAMVAGTPTPVIYQAPSCVMAHQEHFAHRGAAGFNELRMNNSPVTVGSNADYVMWALPRRLASASMYRHVPDFASSTRVLKGNIGDSFTLIAASEAKPGDAVLAVVNVDGWQLTIEYRINTGDDAGLVHPSAPPVLAGTIPLRGSVHLHSIGRRALAPGFGEMNPIVFEGWFNAAAGASLNLRRGKPLQNRVRVRVEAIDERVVVISTGYQVH